MCKIAFIILIAPRVLDGPFCRRRHNHTLWFWNFLFLRNAGMMYYTDNASLDDFALAYTFAYITFNAFNLDRYSMSINHFQCREINHRGRKQRLRIIERTQKAMNSHNQRRRFLILHKSNKCRALWLSVWFASAFCLYLGWVFYF